MSSVTDDRDVIFARIREALRVPAPGPKHATIAQPETSRAASLPVLNEADGYARWLPPVPADPVKRLALFAANVKDLRAELHVVPDADAAAGVLRLLASDGAWDGVATHRHRLCDAVFDRWADAPDLFRTDQTAAGFENARGYDLGRLEKASVGVTACDALVAQTGSVLLTSRSCGGRAVSVLPPHHVVLATVDQLLGDLPSAFALLRDRYADAWPSWMGFVTGPSRTGDIERILVLGAHGPKRLTIVLIENGPTT